jgi:quercetin dioxygenase-like cupin family protein
MFIETRFFSDDKIQFKFDPREFVRKMANSGGFGKPLLSQNGFGADLIFFAAGKGVQNHTHPGDHILFVFEGEGYVIYEGVPHKLVPGGCYFVPGSVDHAIKAETDLVLLSCANHHFPVESTERMSPVPYRTYTDELMQVRSDEA